MNNNNVTKLQINQKRSLKTKIEWIILIALVAAASLATWSNAFTYAYHYIRCEGKPTEVFGEYYRIPYDKGYGIHAGSDYSNCSYTAPTGKIRDPATKAGAAAQNIKDRLTKLDHVIYVPHGYAYTKPATSTIGGGAQTTFNVTAKSGITFHVRELHRDNVYSYTDLCTKPTSENWSGVIIGKDNKQRDVCRVNLSKYIKDYIVGMSIDKTSIMLQTKYPIVESIDVEAIGIFSSMEKYSN